MKICHKNQFYDPKQCIGMRWSGSDPNYKGTAILTVQLDDNESKLMNEYSQDLDLSLPNRNQVQKPKDGLWYVALLSYFVNDAPTDEVAWRIGRVTEIRNVDDKFLLTCEAEPWKH